MKHLKKHAELEEVTTFLKPIDDRKRKKTEKCSDTEQTKINLSKVAPMDLIKKKCTNFYICMTNISILSSQMF